MRSIEHTAHWYRSLNLRALSQSLESLLAQAEANELSYLQFAELLAEHECQQRNRKRVALHRAKLYSRRSNHWRRLTIAISRP